MSDSLSQEQIDALLSQSSLDSPSVLPGDDGSRDSSDAKNYDALGEALGILRQQAATVINTLVNRTVDIELLPASAGSSEVLEVAFDGPCLSINIPYEGGIEGVLHFIVTKKTVAGLSDLMMMGDGTAEYAEEHKDAIGEIFSQITGAFNNSFGSTTGTPVSSGMIDVVEFDYKNSPFDLSSCDMAVLAINVEGLPEAKAVIIVPDEMSRAMISMMSGPSPSAADSSSRGVGLNSAELDDLSRVTMDFGGDSSGGGFRPAPLGPQVNAPAENIGMLMDVELDVSIELGRANLSIKKVLELAPGSIVELDKMAGEPVDLLVNNKVVAKGEVVVVDENFGIRIVSLVSPEERIKSLR